MSPRTRQVLYTTSCLLAHALCSPISLDVLAGFQRCLRALNGPPRGSEHTGTLDMSRLDTKHRGKRSKYLALLANPCKSSTSCLWPKGLHAFHIRRPPTSILQRSKSVRRRFCHSVPTLVYLRIAETLLNQVLTYHCCIESSMTKRVTNEQRTRDNSADLRCAIVVSAFGRAQALHLHDSSRPDCPARKFVAMVTNHADFWRLTNVVSFSTQQSPTYGY